MELSKLFKPKQGEGVRMEKVAATGDPVRMEKVAATGDPVRMEKVAVSLAA